MTRKLKLNAISVVRFIALATFLVIGNVAQAASFGPSTLATDGWGKWWLPGNYSEHGAKVDLLFLVIFIVTGVVGVGVIFMLVKYCIQYRHRADSKAHFTHGNKKLETIWTIIPAILLLALAIWTKGAWDEFRYASTQNKDNAARIMVIAEQFNWNTIYPGPDGKFGRYLIYPKTTDAKWPALPADQQNFFKNEFAGMKRFEGQALPPGPAFLPPDAAKDLINSYIAQVNKLGKDFTDPLGLDDDYKEALARRVYVPKGRLVEVTLTSKDVIHDFFLPHFRVKLDAVPGMKGLLYFTPTQTTAEYEKAAQTNNRREYTIEEAEKLAGYGVNLRVIVPEDPTIAANYAYVIQREVTKKVRGKDIKSIEKTDVQLVTGDLMDKAIIARLKERGSLPKFEGYAFQPWEVVCEELCGNSHTSMRGMLEVIEPDDYRKRFETKPAPETAEAPEQLPSLSKLN